jgi:predicted RNase H-like HicB family nuclease
MPKYVYPAVFTPEDGGQYSVNFPDLQNCFTSGENLSDAIDMAQDVLCLMLYDAEESGAEIPAASDISKISAPAGCFASLIACDTLEYRKLHKNSAVKKTLSIPSWLNAMAEKNGVNFSQILQDALKAQLHI